ncbi:prolipoprotein diacylglyceryl transferase [Candidatus Woesearchaeota archaeon]|nr:prolipoprotein diacylglyceryl transferase [Candidatus Woesearchaeota archaeon]
MSFVHNINPILVNIGPFEIRYYGLVYVIGFLVIYLTLIYYSKKKILKLTRDEAEWFSIYLILGVVIGARLFEVFGWSFVSGNPLYYIKNPWKIFAVWEGGMSLHGGIIGIVLAGYLYCRKKKLNVVKVADILVTPAAFVLALGRIGNFINGELVGTITNVSWCFKFPRYEGCRHPVQLYAAAGRALLGGFLLFLNKKKWKDGFLFWVFILLMGIGRFFCDFLREDPRLFGLSFGQYLSLVMTIIGIVVLIKYYRKELTL